MKNRHSQTMKVPILIDFIYFFNVITKANPSPNGNGFAFNLFGDPYGIRSGLRICKIADFIGDFAFFNKEIIKEIEQFYLSILVFFQ